MEDRDTETLIENEQRQHWKKIIEIGTTWEGKTWLQDHKAVLDLSQNLLQAKTLKIENAKNFKDCLKLSPQYFMPMIFQLSTYGK